MILFNIELKTYNLLKSTFHFKQKLFELKDLKVVRHNLGENSSKTNIKYNLVVLKLIRHALKVCLLVFEFVLFK
jgi:hypothetical protein